jgi:vacuolar-type H+-ATPase subunit E/Vma4
MGLINARNLSKAKALLEKNRHKVGDYVEKATEQLDKVSKGKTNDVSRKIDGAARKYSDGATVHQGVHPDAAVDTPPATSSSREPLDEAELARRQAEANIAAANAVKAAADAANSILGKAAAQANAARTAPASGDASTNADTSADSDSDDPT